MPYWPRVSGQILPSLSCLVNTKPNGLTLNQSPVLFKKKNVTDGASFSECPGYVMG